MKLPEGDWDKFNQLEMAVYKYIVSDTCGIFCVSIGANLISINNLHVEMIP